VKPLLNWRDKTVVQHFNEVTLWSAPFGRLLLENIPMKKGMTVLDIGFGTGFPLIELSQRFGEHSKVYGVDIWPEAIALVKDKIEFFKLTNVTILEESAVKISMENQKIDLVTSNLGINNFEDKETVYKEVHRILKPNGSLCITTNPIGTFKQLFDLFDRAFDSLNMPVQQKSLQTYVENRQTKELICKTFSKNGFQLINSITDATNIKFTDAEALLNHGLIRIGFRESWEQMIPEVQKEAFFNLVKELIEQEIQTNGIFEMTIPMLYLEFKKTA